MQSGKEWRAYYYIGLRNIWIITCSSTWSLEAWLQLCYPHKLHNISSRSCLVPHKRTNISSYPGPMGLKFSSQAEEGKSLGIQGNVGRYERETESKSQNDTKREHLRLFLPNRGTTKGLADPDEQREGPHEDRRNRARISEAGQRKQNQLQRTVCASNLSR
jgi:hypothetical protein